MIEKIDGTILTIDGKRYDALRDLECLEEASGRQKTYLRKPTKIKVYKELKSMDADLFNAVTTRYWWTTELDNAVNGVATQVESNTNTNGGVNLMDNQMLSKLITAIDNISDMHKIEFAEQKVEQYAKDFIEKTYGKLPVTYDIRVTDTDVKRIEGQTHKIFPKVLKYVNMGKNIMLVGPAGTGKNYMCEQIANALGGKFFYTNSLTLEYKLTGYEDASGKYHSTPIRDALDYANAHLDEQVILMLDEFDTSSSEVATLANSLLANRYMNFADGKRITAPSNVKFICGANTFGTGADALYVSRNVLDAATLDRFIVVKMNYDTNLETHLCPDNELKQFIYDIRKSAKKNHINAVFGMRCLTNAYEMLMNDISRQDIVQDAIIKGLGEDDINVIKHDLDTSNSWYKEFKFVDFE